MVGAEALPNFPVEAIRRSGLIGAATVSRKLNYIYVQNWKCGSSTVRTTLWAAEHAMGLAPPPGSPHKPSRDTPFVSDPTRWEKVDDQFVFTIARNPYVRVLSAYLDKIHRHRDQNVWSRFAAQHGLGERQLDFGEFLTIVAATPEAQMDPHWRPQSCNLVPSLIPYDFIGSMENFEADLGHILGRIFPDRVVPIQSHKPHQTGSASRLTEFYGARELRLVREIYGRDFLELGYDLDLGNPARRQPPARCDSQIIRDWGRACRLMAEGDYAQAEQGFVALRPWIDGPYVHEQILHCRCELKDTDKSLMRDGVTALEQALRHGHDEWSAWKWYGQGLVRLGRVEDGYSAMLTASEHQPGGAHRAKRIRRLVWRLALLRASKGRLREALDTLARVPPDLKPERNEPGSGALSALRRGVLRVVAAAAVLIGARHWHPDRELGIPAAADARRRGAAAGSV